LSRITASQIDEICGLFHGLEHLAEDIGLQQSKRHRMSGLSLTTVVLTEALKGRA
jgi:hypothetical protein